jgi:hypothetical protein
LLTLLPYGVPTLPIWLEADFAVPLGLEPGWEGTLGELRVAV